MATIIDDITTILRDAGPQLVMDSLAQKAQMDGKPSLFALINWDNPANPNGHQHKVRVSDNTSAGTFPEGGPFNAADKSEFEQFNLSEFARYHFTVEATGSELARLEAAGDVLAEITDFLGTQFRLGQGDVRDEMEEDLHSNDPDSGGDSDGFYGLAKVMQDNNTYGGINAGTYALTGAYVNDNSGTPRSLTKALMDDVHATLTDTRRGTYDFILTSETQFQNYVDLSTGMPSAEIMQGLNFMAGWTSASYKGRPIIAVPGYPTDVMDFMTRSALQGSWLRNWRIKQFEEHDKTRWAMIGELQFWVENRGRRVARLGDLS